MTHIDEYRLARILLERSTEYETTSIERLALSRLLHAFETGGKLDEESARVARWLFRAVAFAEKTK